MRADILPWVAVILGLAGGGASLWTAHQFELVPDCSVFIDGCSSISGSASKPPAVFIFRGAMIPVAVLLMLIWAMTARWLQALGAGSSGSRLFIGLAGSAAPALAIVYMLLLGVDQPRVEAIQDWSIRVYFVVALVVMIVTAVVLLRHARKPTSTLPRWLPGVMLWVAVVLLAVAIGGAVVNALVDDAAVMRNLLQWYATTVFVAWHLLLGHAWNRSGRLPRVMFYRSPDMS